MTPPELARKSGTSVTPLSERILSPSGVTGPLAPSTRYLAFTLSAVLSFRTPSSAQGNRKSQSTNRTSETPSFSQPSQVNPSSNFLGCEEICSKAFFRSMPFGE